MWRAAALGAGVLLLAGVGACGDEPVDTTAGGGTATVDATAIGELTYPIVDTGQTAFYDNIDEISAPASGEPYFGQDAGYAGLEPSYVHNGDGTITDRNTGLMWQQDPGAKMTYAEAVAGAEDFELAGYTDWRLPTIKELYSLILFSGTDPSGCEAGGGCGDSVPFIDTDHFAFVYGDESAGERLIDAQFLTSTEYVGTTMDGDETVFGVNFADGRIKGYGLSDPRGGEKTFFVLYVRGNPAYGSNELTDNGDGTITDTATGLVWVQADSEEALEWAGALD